MLVDGRLEKRQSAMRPAEECRVFIRDHHVGYIDWATYEENQRNRRHRFVALPVHAITSRHFAPARVFWSGSSAADIVGASCMYGIGVVAAPMHATFVRATMMVAGSIALALAAAR